MPFPSAMHVSTVLVVCCVIGVKCTKCNILARLVPSHSSCVYASVCKGCHCGELEGSFQISRSRLAVVAMLIELSSYIVLSPDVSTSLS